MKHIIIDKFINSLSVDEDGIIIEFSSILEAEQEALNCQDGLVIPLNTDKLFTKAQVLDILIAFDQSVNPEEYNSSKELESCDFRDAAYCKAEELGLKEEYIKASDIYANLSDFKLENYNPNNLI